MLRHWETFDDGPNITTSELRVTLNAKGDIMIGTRAFQRLGQPEAAILLYDKSNSSIGIRPAHERHPHAQPLKPKPGARHRFIRANSFCRRYGISTNRTLVFGNVTIDDGTLILDLRTTTALSKAST